MSGEVGNRTDREAGAEEAEWERVYREQARRVYNFFRYRVGDDAVAEDLTADTFERAWKHRHRYRNDAARFSAWLFSIARNLSIDHHRRRHWRRRLAIQTAESMESDIERSAEEGAVNTWDLEKLKKLLHGLPDREIDLVALKFGAGMTNREMAKLLDLTESNVGTLLYRVIKKLRANWEK